MTTDKAGYDVDAATVEIKRLTVSGKQMTQSVFRQLYEEQLVLDDGTLAGQPWGRVNHHPPQQCPASAPKSDHWHVVWQDGDELRRAYVSKTVEFRDDYHPDEGLRFISSCVHEVATAGTTRYFNGELPWSKLCDRYGDGLRVPTGYGFSAYLDHTEATYRVAMALRGHVEYPRSNMTYVDRKQYEAEQSLSARLPALATEVAAYGATTDELYAQYAAACDAENARRNRIRATRDSMAELPQLFIA